MLLALVAALALATPGPAQAQGTGQDGAYTARGVPIEASAASAAQAREQAIAEGQVKAFRAMLEQITEPADHGRLPNPSADRIRSMVETYSLADERTTDTTYKARITVQYDDGAVGRLLQAQGIGHAASAAQPVLVLPVYQSSPDARGQLWEDTNPWLTAWRRQEANNVLLPLEVPTGDLTDVTTVSADQALAPDSAALERLVGRYDRSQVLVAHAVRTGPDSVAVSMNYGSPRAMAQTGRQTVTKRAGENDAAFLTRVATEMAGRLEGDWRSATMVSTGAARPATALITLAGFDDWMRIRSALDRSPLIRDYAIQALTRSRAQVRLTALGEAGRVAETLRAEGISLTEQGGYWIISRLGSSTGQTFGATTPPPGGGVQPHGAPGGTAPPAGQAGQPAQPGFPQPGQGQGQGQGYGNDVNGLQPPPGYQ